MRNCDFLVLLTLLNHITAPICHVLPLPTRISAPAPRKIDYLLAVYPPCLKKWGVVSRDAEAEAEAEAEAPGSGTFSVRVEAEAEAHFCNSLEAEAEAKADFFNSLEAEAEAKKEI